MSLDENVKLISTDCDLLSRCFDAVDESKDEEKEEVALTLDPSLDWEVNTDIYPLLNSTHVPTQRLAAYFSALVSHVMCD